MRSAFVSHSTSDDRYVAEMESFLRAAGVDDVFNDVSAIRPEEKFSPEIEKDDFAIAEKLINVCGCHRRNEELADAKAAILLR